VATWGSSNVFEVPGSRTETYTRKEMTAKVTLLCPWSTRFAEMEKITRTRYPLPAGASEYLHPAYPKTLDVTVWEEQGSASDVHVVSYTQAKIDATYHCLAKFNWDQSFSQTITPTLQMRRLPSWGFYWASDGSPVLDEESPTIFAPQAKITRQYTGVSEVPQWFWDLAGCVNNVAWTEIHTSSLLGAGTLLFIPAAAVKQMTANPEDRDPLWDVSFDLIWNPIGWNRFMRQNGVMIQAGIRTDQMIFNNSPYFMYPERPFPFK